MVPTPTQTSEGRLRPILDRVYRAFDAPAPRPPLLICNCNSCLTPQEQKEFCSYPLREIPAGFLQAYLSSVSEGVCHRRSISTAHYFAALEPGSPYTEGDLRSIRQRQYYLPRILEGLVRGEEMSILAEVTLQKFAFDCPGAYTTEQLGVVEDFACAWCEELCRFPHPYHPCHQALPWMLEMLWAAGLDLTGQLCAIWLAHVEHVPAVRNYLGLREIVVPPEVHAPEIVHQQAGPVGGEVSISRRGDAGRAGRTRSGRQQAEPRNSTNTVIPATAETSLIHEEGIASNEYLPTVGSFSAELANWAFNPAVQAAFTSSLEKILLAGAEEPEETQEWEGWYFYLSGS